MSGSYQRPQAFNPVPLGPNFGQSIADAARMTQLWQVKQEVEKGNALQNIMQRPGALDAMGQPTPETMTSVMGVDVNAGLKLQQASLAKQQQTLQVDQFKTKAFAQQFEMTKDVSDAAYTTYKREMEGGTPEPAARAAAQKVQNDGLERLEKSGLFSEDQKKAWPRQFDPIQAAAHVQTYDQWQKAQETKKKDEREDARIRESQRRDDLVNERAGTTVLQDPDGRPYVVIPHAGPGKPKASYMDGTPVPDDKLIGARKIGGGAAAGKDADNAAIDAKVRKDHPEWDDGQVKLERMRQVSGATSKALQDPSKGWVIRTDEDGTEFQHHNGTGENKSMDGAPYVIKGHSAKEAGPRSVSIQDRAALEAVTKSEYEKELDRPVNLADPNEKAELARRVLKAEDDRAAGRAGAVAGAQTAARGGNDRLGQVRVARDALQKELGRPLTPADDAQVEERVMAAEDQRKRAAKLETPAQAAERDAMSVADKKIADKEAADGRPLDDAEKAVIRQESRSDPKVAEAARKKGENFGVPDSPEERESVAAQVATGMPLTQVVPGFGNAAVLARKQARGDAIRLIREQNPQMSAADAGVELANRGIEYISGRKSSGQLTTMLGATRQGVMQLDFNIDKTKQEMKKLGATNLSPILNAIYRGEERWTGNPAYTSLFYYMNATAMESARILSGGQASIQQLHEGARKEAERWININMTPASFDAVAKAIQDEGHYRVETFEKALEQQRIGAPKGQQGQTEKIPTITHDDAGKKAYEALPPGAEFISEGRHYRKPEAQAAPPASKAATPDVSTMRSATGPDGKKLYWNGQSWINPDGTPYKP